MGGCTSGCGWRQRCSAHADLDHSHFPRAARQSCWLVHLVAWPCCTRPVASTLLNELALVYSGARRLPRPLGTPQASARTPHGRCSACSVVMAGPLGPSCIPRYRFPIRSKQTASVCWELAGCMKADVAIPLALQDSIRALDMWLGRHGSSSSGLEQVQGAQSQCRVLRKATSPTFGF